MDIKILHLIEGARQARGLAVVIDVFRAFSVACYAAAAGVKKIIPVGDLDTAYALKERHAEYLLIGERKGRKLPGFDYGNSPTEIENVDLRGKTAIQTTSAGTQGLVSAQGAEQIITGSFVNAQAVCSSIRRSGINEVSLVCMGHEGKKERDEDRLCAEYLRSVLEEHPLEFAAIREHLRSSDGAQKFFDPEKDWAPRSDFDLCLDLDRFSFVLRAEKEDSLLVLKRLDVGDSL